MMIAHLFLFVLLAQPSPHRGATVRRESQRTHPSPSTDLMRGACSGYVKDHVIIRLANFLRIDFVVMPPSQNLQKVTFHFLRYKHLTGTYTVRRLL